MGNAYTYNAKRKHTQCNYVDTKHKPTKLSKGNAKANKCNWATKIMKQNMQTQCPSSFFKITNTKSCHKAQIKNAKRVKFSR